MVCFAWIAVLRPSDMKWGFGRTGSFIVPPNVQELVNSIDCIDIYFRWNGIRES